MGNYFCQEAKVTVRSSHRVTLQDSEDHAGPEPTKEKQQEFNEYMYSSVTQPLHQFKEEDFEKIKQIGKGAFGLVFLVKLRETGEMFAMKQISKKLIFKQNISDLVLRQRKMMTRIKNNFIIKLYYAFQDKYNCTFVMEYAGGGDVCQLLYPKILTHLSIFYRENLQVCSKFILACVISGLQCLHKQDIHYRDLKPENIMLMANGYFKLIDFGLVRTDRVDPKSTAIAGTPLYFAPEVLKKESTKLSDLWALGVFAYELFFLQPPFKRKQILSPNFQSYCLKAQSKRKWRGQISEAAKNFIDGLLKVDPFKRLGAGNFSQIKNHEYFKGFQWDRLDSLNLPSPFQNEIQDFNIDGCQYVKPLTLTPQQSIREQSIRGFTFYYDN